MTAEEQRSGVSHHVSSSAGAAAAIVEVGSLMTHQLIEALKEGRKHDEIRLLIVGPAGVGKTTLFNAKRDESRSPQPAATGKDVRGVTKTFQHFHGKPINGKPVLLIDMPGIGDKDVKPLQLWAYIERILTQSDGKVAGGIHGVIACVKSDSERFDLSSQVVQLLIEKGVVHQQGSCGGWDNIVLVGTMSDKIKDDEEQQQFFRDKLAPTFFEKAPEAARRTVKLVNKDDYSQLDEAIAMLPSATIQYAPQASDVLAEPLGELLGIDPERVRAALDDHRAEADRRWLSAGASVLVKLAAGAGMDVARDRALVQIAKAMGKKAATKEAGKQATKAALKQGGKAAATAMLAVACKSLSPAAIVADLAEAGLEVGGQPAAGKAVGLAGNAGIAAGCGAMAAGPVGAAVGACAGVVFWGLGQGVGALFDKGKSWHDAAAQLTGNKPVADQKKQVELIKKQVVDAEMAAALKEKADALVAADAAAAATLAAKDEMARVADEKNKVARAKAAAEKAKADADKAFEDAHKSRLWSRLADGVTDLAAVQQLFAARQNSVGGGATLRIESAVYVANDQALSSFNSTGHFDIDPLSAHKKRCDTLLFHGTSEVAVPNIEASGRPTMQFAANGMLGRGIYGGQDPRKSLHYCRKTKSANGNFMFICRYNLSNAQHAGPSTPHRNRVFDEFCVYDDSHVVVLWMLKLAL